MLSPCNRYVVGSNSTQKTASHTNRAIQSQFIVLNSIVIFSEFIIPLKDAEPATSSSTTNERAESVGLLGKGPLPLPATITILPPSTGDDHDSDSSYQSEDEGRPLTQQELRQRIVKGVSTLLTANLSSLATLTV